MRRIGTLSAFVLVAAFAATGVFSVKLYYLYQATAARAAAAEQLSLETLYRFEKEETALTARVNALEGENGTLAKAKSTLEADRAKLSQTLGAQTQLLDVQGKLSAAQQQKITEQGSTIGNLQTTVGTVSTELQQLKKIGGEPLPKDFINSLLQATARIRCLISQDGTTAHYRAGSGSLLGRYPAADNKLVIMTNGHVVADNEVTGTPRCEVVFGENTVFGATVVKRVFDDTYDFALMKLGEPKTSVTVQPVSYDDLGIGFCEAQDVEVGDRITIVSYPHFTGPENAVSDGYVTNIFDDVKGPIYEGSAIIDNGSSGGVALLNKKRCALGMPTWKGLGDKLGLSYMQSWPLMLSYRR